MAYSMEEETVPHEYERVSKSQLSQRRTDSSNSFIVSLSSTRLPRCEEDKEFFKDFRYSWHIKSFLPKEKFFSARSYAENFPYINLSQLLKTFPNISNEQQYSVHFTDRDIRHVLELYYQGKLDIKWSLNGFNFNQYSADKLDYLHTIAVTRQGQYVTYYRQQRYIDNQFSQIDDVFFDSRYQVEYWYDDTKSKWVLDHPYNGEVEYTKYRHALRSLRKLGKINTKSENLACFTHPYIQWVKGQEDWQSNEEFSPSIWKTAIMGYLILTGDIFRNLLTIPNVKKIPSLEPLAKVQNAEVQNFDIFDLIPERSSHIEGYGNVLLTAGLMLTSNKYLKGSALPITVPLLLFGVSACEEKEPTSSCAPSDNQCEAQQISTNSQLATNYKDYYMWEHNPSVKNPTQGYSQRIYKMPLGTPIAIDGLSFQPTFESRDQKKEFHKIRELEPRQWEHLDEYKYSYPLGEIYLSDNQKNVNITIESGIRIPPAHPYIQRETYNRHDSIKWIDEDKCLRPRMNFQRQWFYERPDGNRYEVHMDIPQEFPLNKITHLGFKSDEDSSYQTIKIAVENPVMGYNEVYNYFEATNVKYPHHKKYLLLSNDDSKRTCTYQVQTYVIPNFPHCGFLGTTKQRFIIGEEAIIQRYKYIKEVPCTLCISHTHMYARCGEEFGEYGKEIGYRDQLPDEKVVNSKESEL